MAKQPKKPPKKRNLAAKAARRTGAGPMKDKRRTSRQERKTRDAREEYE